MPFPNPAYTPVAVPIGTAGAPSFVFFDASSASAITNHGAFQPDTTAFAWAANGEARVILASKTGAGTTAADYLSSIKTQLALTAIPVGNDTTAQLMFQITGGHVRHLMPPDPLGATIYRLRLSSAGGLQWVEDTAGPGPSTGDITGSGASPRIARWIAEKQLNSSELSDDGTNLTYKGTGPSVFFNIRQTGSPAVSYITFAHSLLQGNISLEDSRDGFSVASSKKLYLSASNDTEFSAARFFMFNGAAPVATSTGGILVRRTTGNLLEPLVPPNTGTLQLVARNNQIGFEAPLGPIGSGRGGYLAVWSGTDGVAGNTITDVQRGTLGSHFLRNQMSAPPVFSAINFVNDITGKPNTLSGYGIEDAYTRAETNNLLATKVPTSRIVGTQQSIEGGGSLAQDRTLNLVGDSTNPGANKVYGTNSGGTRGWQSVLSGGSTGYFAKWTTDGTTLGYGALFEGQTGSDKAGVISSVRFQCLIPKQASFDNNVELVGSYSGGGSYGELFGMNNPSQSGNFKLVCHSGQKQWFPDTDGGFSAQVKNSVFAGPNGSTGNTANAVPTFRALVPLDLATTNAIAGKVLGITGTALAWVDQTGGLSKPTGKPPNTVWVWVRDGGANPPGDSGDWKQLVGSIATGVVVT